MSRKTPNLLHFIRTELETRKGSWPEISSGSGVPYFTLSKIAAGTTKNPRLDTVESLAEYLRAHPRASA